MDLESVDFGRTPASFSDGSLKVEMNQVLGKVHVKVSAPKIDLELDLILHTDLVEQQFFVMPLNEAGSHYYVNNKANGVPITGTYSFEGKDYVCLYDFSSRCHALMDSGRGRFNYHTSWVWGTLLTTIPESHEVFTLNMIYGFGGAPQSQEKKFSEDFLTIDGKHYKLD